MADKINVLIPEETVDAKIKEIGEQISKDYAGKEIAFDLYFKAVYFCMRTGKENHCTSFS